MIRSAIARSASMPWPSGCSVLSQRERRLVRAARRGRSRRSAMRAHPRRAGGSSAAGRGSPASARRPRRRARPGRAAARPARARRSRRARSDGPRPRRCAPCCPRSRPRRGRRSATQTVAPVMVDVAQDRSQDELGGHSPMMYRSRGRAQTGGAARRLWTFLRVGCRPSRPSSSIPCASAFSAPDRGGELRELGKLVADRSATSSHHAGRRRRRPFGALRGSRSGRRRRDRRGRRCARVRQKTMAWRAASPRRGGRRPR